MLARLNRTGFWPVWASVALLYADSYAPESKPVPCGRTAPRASLVRPATVTPESIAGEPCFSAMVGTEPPLLASGNKVDPRPETDTRSLLVVRYELQLES